MRDAIYHGKRIEDGTWIEGPLTITKIQPVSGEAYFIYEILDITRGEFPNDFMSGTADPVFPETIEQYIGRADICGNKIFGGHIVKHYNQISVGQPEAFTVVSIVWDKKRYRWSQYDPVTNEFYTVSDDCVFEIIGNVIDNPELLKPSE